MSEQKSSYKQILKATSLFGGVQVFNILITIVRSKIIAILLGPTGIGIVGLLTSTTSLVSSMTNFGLETSAVKSVAEAHGNGNTERLAKTVTVFRKLVWATGSLGAILTAVLSPWLSLLTFGDKSYTWAFVFLSITLLLNQLTIGQNVILQGTRQLKYLASANMLGSILSLLITVPLYYFFGLEGIVPALIIMAMATFTVASYFSRKVKLKSIQISWPEVKLEGKGMMKLGFFFSLSTLLGALISYLLRIYISNTGGVDDVGLYTAGFQIIGTYVGLVFTAMGTDYFPRLSAVADDDQKRNSLVNQQGIIALLILFPIIVAFIFFAPWVVRLLYSAKFDPINGMIIWAAYGMFFKAISWAIAFQFLAKANSRLFFLNELVVNSYLLLFNIIGYTYYGLLGLGISYFITYLIYLVQVFWITKAKFSFQLSRPLLKMFLWVIVIGAVSIVLVNVNIGQFEYVIYFIFTLVVSIYSIKKLNQLTGLISSIKNRF